PASRYRPDLPQWLSQSLDKALQADPHQRYETAEQWLLEMDQAEHRPVVAKPRPLLEREPLKVWQTLALISMLLNLLLAIWLMSHH
ncbi:Serine/threonine protein kinase, partial [Pseudomonas savastanoi]